jgi:hypothetical protein
MPLIGIVLLVFALVFFVLAGLGIPSPPRFQMGWFGLACIAGYFLFKGI